MRTIAILVFVLLFPARDASAVFQFTLEHSQIRTVDAARLHIDSDFGCYPTSTFNVTRDGSVITVTNTLSDALPCPPEWSTPRLIDLGSFPAGTYDVVIVTCENAPTNPCSVRATLPLLVVQLTGIARVPSLSPWAGLALCVALAFIVRRRAGRGDAERQHRVRPR